MRKAQDFAMAVVAFALFTLPARAEMAVSANDGKQIRRGDSVSGPTPDSVSVIAFGEDAPKVIGSIAVPASMIGPPASVAMAPDYSFVLVTGPQKLDADNKLQPADIVSVIGLDNPTHPTLLQTAHAGPGATGVTMNGKATLALVASTGDDSVTVFSIADRRLAEAGKLQFEAKSEPRDVVIAPDGKTAYVVRWGDGKITKLAIKGTAVTRVLDIPVGVNPDGGIVTPDGRYFFNTDYAGSLITTPKVGAVTAIDLRTDKVVGAVEVGPSPEHVFLSPDGKYLGVVVDNGSASVKTAANYASVLGLIRIFKRTGAVLTPAAQADTGHNCQGAAFSDDGKTILLQCAVERDIEVFHFDGKSLTRDASATLVFESRPGAIATPHSR